MIHKKTFFRDEEGDIRWTFLLVWVGIVTIVCMLLIGPEFAYGFKERFFRTTIWTILCIAAAIYIGFRLDKHLEKERDARGTNKILILIALLYFGGLVGPYVGVKIDREFGIPDATVYYNNGKVINASDPSKDNFYFHTFKVSGADSVYISQHGEEPGYNWIWRSYIQGDPAKISNKPRANEQWVRPAPIKTIELHDSWRK